MGNLSSITIFGFVANWSPFLLAFIIFMTVVYYLVTMKWYNDFDGGRPLTKKETITFFLIMVLFYVAHGSPVNILSHILFSFHMAQMAVTYLLIAPLIFIAVPSYLQKAFFNLPVVKQIFNVAKFPLLSLVLFNAVFSIYHIPVVMDYLKQQSMLHTTFSVFLFILALIMWYPIFNKVEPKEAHMGGLFKLLYIFGIGVLLTPACALIIFASEPMYRTFTDGSAWMRAMELCVPAGVLDGLVGQGQGLISGPEYFTNMSPLHDQQTGGIIMKVLQEVFFGFMLASIFYSWYRDERRDEDEVTRRSLEQARLEKEYYNQFK